MPGGSELFVCLVLALIVLGPKRLPEVAHQAGALLRKFREATAGIQQEIRGAVEPVTAIQREIRSTVRGTVSSAAPILAPQQRPPSETAQGPEVGQTPPPALTDEALRLPTKAETEVEKSVTPPSQDEAGA